MKVLNKKIIAVCCIWSITSLSFSPFFAKKAEAQWIVWDPGNFAPNALTAFNTTLQSPVKEFGLDTIAWMLVNIIIERMAASTVNWINNGFRGSPAFVTDPETYFRNIGDKVTGQIIYNHPDLRFMCAGIRTKVQIALTQNYIRPFNYQCTLGQIDRNFDGFMNDFNQGGWDGFIQLSQNSQNNPLGLYNSWNDERLNRVNSALQRKQEELSQGRGFLSWKSCAQWSEPIAGYTTEARQGVTGLPEDEENSQFGEIPARDVSGIPPKCIKEQVNTPGSVIETQLNSVLGIGNSRLQVADEINEIISALLNQLAARIIGGVGKGLRALGGRDNNTSSRPYFEQLRNASLTDVIPMPANGQCPDYYIVISAEECGTNDQIREDFIRVRAAEAAAETAIEEGRREGQNLPPPPGSQTSVQPLPTPPRARTAPADTSGFGTTTP